MSFLDRWRKRGGGGSDAAKQEGDVHALDREDDPRGGTQSAEYRTADPRDVVEEGGVAMSGPAGAPQAGEPAGERRSRDRDD